jgi:hypothetical protein
MGWATYWAIFSENHSVSLAPEQEEEGEESF